MRKNYDEKQVVIDLIRMGCKIQSEDKHYIDKKKVLCKDNTKALTMFKYWLKRNYPETICPKKLFNIMNVPKSILSYVKKFQSESNLFTFEKVTNIEDRQKTISIDDKVLLGNTSRGKIDFLINYCNYKLVNKH